VSERPASVTICDVGPRDGLQNERLTLAPATRAKLVNGLLAAGLGSVEVGSFVSPRAVPQMDGAEQVIAGVLEQDAKAGRYDSAGSSQTGVTLSALVVNERGYDRLAKTAVSEVHFAFAATETFNQRNQKASVKETLTVAGQIAKRAHDDGRRMTVTIGASFGCPFEGSVAPGRVQLLAERVAADGADAVVLADTIGVAVPAQLRRLLPAIAELDCEVGVHLHNTRSTGIVNAFTALECGITYFDASVGGIGGCPFAPRATGNIATEDLVYLLHGEGVQTGIDLDALIGVAQSLESELGRELPGGVYRAGSFAPVASGRLTQEQAEEQMQVREAAV
jgi:hydroxymethylglutaryl-CoA lyase/(R)-citramalyl-CoA lyase